MPKITTFLMFEGKAEDAMNFYVSLFDHSEILSVSRYSEDGPGEEGKVSKASFSINGQEFMCTDSFVTHEFSFTPSMSLYVSCETEDEINRVFSNLSENGNILMPLNVYPFSQKFGWVTDQFGVSWQLNLINK